MNASNKNTMSRNPYAAPEAAVADPMAHLRGRPKEVTSAVRLQWVGIALMMITALILLVQQLELAEPISPAKLVRLGEAFAFVMGQCLLVAWLTLRVAAGRGWARWFLLALAALSGLLSLLQATPAAYTIMWLRSPVGSVLGALDCVLPLLATGMLLMPRAGAWFKAGKPQQSRNA